MSESAPVSASATRIGDVSPEELASWVAAPLEQAGFELVECRWLPRTHILRLSIDLSVARAESLGLDPTRSGVTIDDCQAASHAVSSVLDSHPVFAGDEKWSLEVSSPGVERPLFSLQDYRRFAGMPVHLKLKRGANPTGVPKASQGVRLDATLVGANDQGVEIDWQNQSLRISLEDIERANLRLVF